jgi:hypothetical protein
VPPPGAIVIDGVNHHLNGVSNAQDFWPAGPFQHQGQGVIQTVDDAVGGPAPVPEPGTLALLLTGGLPMARTLLRRRQRRSSDVAQ